MARQSLILLLAIIFSVLPQPTTAGWTNRVILRTADDGGCTNCPPSPGAPGWSDWSGPAGTSSTASITRTTSVLTATTATVSTSSTSSAQESRAATTTSTSPSQASSATTTSTSPSQASSTTTPGGISTTSPAGHSAQGTSTTTTASVSGQSSSNGASRTSSHTSQQPNSQSLSTSSTSSSSSLPGTAGSGSPSTSSISSSASPSSTPAASSTSSSSSVSTSPPSPASSISTSSSRASTAIPSTLTTSSSASTPSSSNPTPSSATSIPGSSSSTQRSLQTSSSTAPTVQSSQGSGSSPSPVSSEAISVLSQPSTVTGSGTTFVTVVITTLTFQSSILSGASQSSSQGVPSPASPGSRTTPRPTSPNPISLATLSISSSTEPPLPCPLNITAWCAPSPTSPVPSNSYCLCPFCWAGWPVCSAFPPANTSVCPFGWVCSVTIATDSSTPVPSLPPGLTWNDQNTQSAWNIFVETITATDGSGRTTTVSFDAALTTFTINMPSGVWIDWPFRNWHCLGPLCDIPGVGILCKIDLFCKKNGNGGFPSPPIPAQIPMGPPELGWQTQPTTHSGTQKTSESTTESSSSSCSASPVSSCLTVCSTVMASSSATQECSTSCVTTTECSGTDVISTTTVNSSTAACSVSQFWSDPAISNSIESWISQFPFTFESMNATVTTPTTWSCCTGASCALTQGITSTTFSSFTPLSTVSTGCTDAICALMMETSWTVTSTDDIGNVFSSVMIFSNGSRFWGSSTQIYTQISTPVTITSSTRSFSDVTIFTRGGVDVSGSSSCTESFAVATTSEEQPPNSEQTQHCAAWVPKNMYLSPLPTMHGKMAACATPARGSMTSILPTPWNPAGQQLNWFKSSDLQVNNLCADLHQRQIVIHDGDPVGKNSPGECSIYHQEDIALGGYGITISLAYDARGCQKNDYYANGVNFSCFPFEACRDPFMKLVDDCTIKGKGHDNLKINDFDSIGGVAFHNCMRWTIVAINDDGKPPVTGPFQEPDSDTTPDDHLPSCKDPDDDDGNGLLWFLCFFFFPACFFADVG